MFDRRALVLLWQTLPRMELQTGISGLVVRLKLIGSAFQCRKQLNVTSILSSPALLQLINERPETLFGALIWPYVCAAWNAPERLARLKSHYRLIDRLGGPFPFSVSERFIIANLNEVYPGLRVVLDQPQWFLREGGLTLNLFVGEFRAYSLAFSFAENPDGGIDCLIGAIQGRKAEGATDLYRELTKSFHGVRPRDLLIEIIRILCRYWEVSRLLGVRDEQRHHRHPFFGGKAVIPQNYDAVWFDRGGQPEDDHFFRVPIESPRRAADQIRPNKRALYRRRYCFLDDLEGCINATLSAVERSDFRIGSNVHGMAGKSHHVRDEHGLPDHAGAYDGNTVATMEASSAS